MPTHSITLPSGSAGVISGARVHWWYWRWGYSMVDDWMLTLQRRHGRCLKEQRIQAKWQWV